MKALIVAAGQGLRLRGVAQSKPLALVQGVPLIEHVIVAAAEAGVDEFVVVTGYEGARLTRRLGEISARLGLPITCTPNPEWLRANGVSVLAARAQLPGPFALLMADHLFDPSILRDLMRQGDASGAVVLAVDRRLDNPLVDLDDVTRVQTGPDGALRRIGKLIEAYDAFDTGLFLAGPPLLRALDEDVQAGGAGSISAGMQRLADAGLARTFDVDARFWLDVDDAVALGQAEAREREVAPAERRAAIR